MPSFLGGICQKKFRYLLRQRTFGDVALTLKIEFIWSTTWKRMTESRNWTEIPEELNQKTAELRASRHRSPKRNIRVYMVNCGWNKRVCMVNCGWNIRASAWKLRNGITVVQCIGYLPNKYSWTFSLIIFSHLRFICSIYCRGLVKCLSELLSRLSVKVWKNYRRKNDCKAVGKNNVQCFSTNNCFKTRTPQVWDFGRFPASFLALTGKIVNL